MVGFDSRYILNSRLLQTRLWELRPDEDWPRAFFHYKLSSPFPVSEKECRVSTLVFFFLSLYVICLFLSFSLFLFISYSLYLYLSLSLSLYIVSLCAANCPNICRLHRFLYIRLYGHSFYFQQQNGAYIMFILHTHSLMSLDIFAKYYPQQELRDRIRSKQAILATRRLLFYISELFC